MAELAVIIPAYNAEKTLVRTIDSIRASTFRDLEIWIVDDGSTDGTAQLAEAFATADARIRVCHQKNKGIYLARLHALRQITTPYFAFADADDWVEPTLYERVMALMHAHDLDILEYECFGKGKNDGSLTLLTTEEKLYQGYIFPCLMRGPVYVWDKVYRHRFDFKTFAECAVVRYEDMIFNLQFFATCKRFGHLHEALYHYDVNAESSVRNYRSRYLDDFITTFHFRRQAAPWYRLQPDDLRLEDWVMINARDNFVLASHAPASSWKERFDHLHALANATEIRLSLDRLKAQGACNHLSRVVRCCVTLPKGMGLFYFMAKHLQLRLRRFVACLKRRRASV